MIDLEKKLGEDIISEEDYITGLMGMIDILIVDLSDYLKQENRKFGIVNSYLNSIENAYEKLPTPDIEIAEKMMYLYKSSIMSEYRRLKGKRFSKADCIIVILKNILDILVEHTMYSSIKEVKTINKIITKLFDNIHNQYKTTPLYGLNNIIYKYIDLGLTGKYRLENFSITKEESVKKIKEPLEGSGLRLNEEDTKLNEIVWKED